MKIWMLTHSTLFSFAIFTFGLQAAYAQIIPDSTVGTIVAPSGISTDIINGGQERGNNLFHSFSEFTSAQNVEFTLSTLQMLPIYLHE